jgi:hypothetical protein
MPDEMAHIQPGSTSIYGWKLLNHHTAASNPGQVKPVAGCVLLINELNGYGD